ncbi:MAG: uroporphyrinogen decarboxylase/cobalamine-independent methonine synthase family protein [Anaerolineae bacterium]
MSINVRFDEQNWDRIERDYTAWWAHALERPLVQIGGAEYDPRIEYPDVPNYTSNFPMSMSAEEAISQIGTRLEAARYYGDAYPGWFPNFGPGIAAGFMGCIVHSVPETVWFEPEQVCELRDIHPTYDADNLWLRRVRDLVRAAVDAWEGKVQVCHPDLGGNLDIVASLRTTQALLYDLYDVPDEVDRLVHEVTQLWLRYYDEFDAIIRPACRGTAPWAPIWGKGAGYMLQCDFSYMLSPEMFERFVLPDLTACCDRLDHGFYHLDGRGEIAHLPMLLGMERLRGIQWVPGDGTPPPHEWLDLLRQIIAGGKLCQLFLSAEGALHIVRNLGGRGFMFTISDRMDKGEADAFLALLAREDQSRRG